MKDWKSLRVAPTSALWAHQDYVQEYLFFVEGEARWVERMRTLPLDQLLKERNARYRKTEA
jgi:hypothetical protein